MDYQRMGKQIRMYRQLQGLTQERLAKMVGVSTSFIGHIERGSRKSSLETLEGICIALGISMDAVAMPPRSDLITAPYTDEQLEKAIFLLETALEIAPYDTLIFLMLTVS